MAKASYGFGIVHSNVAMAQVHKGEARMVRGGTDLYRGLEEATVEFEEMCAEAHAAPEPRKWQWCKDDRVSLVTRRGKVLAEMIPLRG
jgi:hypothetical protein